MNPLAVFILAFLLWITSPLYLPKLNHQLKAKLGEITAYWTVVSIFDILLAVFVTLLCPAVYFVRWDFPVKAFLVLFTLSVLSFLPSIDEFKRFLNPETEEDREMVEFIENSSLPKLAFLQVISSALPEELSFRYVFLGLLSLWNPFAGLVAISVFFGLSHRFSHSTWSWRKLLSATLGGLVFGLGYLYTKSLLVVMAVHWLDNLIPELYVKYGRARKAIVVAVAISLLSPLVFWEVTVGLISYLHDTISLPGLLWGILISSAMLGVVYAGVKAIRGRGGL